MDVLEYEIEYSRLAQIVDDQNEERSLLFIERQDGEMPKIKQCGTNFQPMAKFHLSRCEWAKDMHILMNVPINAIR